MRTPTTPGEPVSTPGDDPVTALADDLGVPRDEVAWLDAADDATLAHLHAALDAAHARQEEALREAFEGTISVVPRPLRGRVRKLLMGG